MKFVQEYIDNRGKKRAYFRRYSARFALPVDMESEEFKTEYRRLLDMSVDELLSEAEGRKSPAQKRKEPPNSGWVYFLSGKNEKMIKIGYSKDPNKRASELQVASADKLSIKYAFRGTMADERRLHKLFSKYRRNGEWFHDTDNEIYGMICRIRENGTKTECVSHRDWMFV